MLPYSPQKLKVLFMFSDMLMYGKVSHSGTSKQQSMLYFKALFILLLIRGSLQNYCFKFSCLYLLRLIDIAFLVCIT